MEILYWSLPFIFIIIEILLIRYNDSYLLDNNKSIWSFIIPIIDGTIFFGLQLLIYHFLNYLNINFTTFKSLMYGVIILHTLFMIIFCIAIYGDELEFPIVGSIAYSFIALLLIVILVPIFAICKFENDLEKIDYEYQNTETIYLSSMNGEFGESGILKGNYRYINFVLEGSYRIYYVEKEEDGNLVIDYIDYDKDKVKIFEDDGEIPRIEINHYKKELINPENGEVILDSVKEDYVLYIPEGTYDTKFDSGF